MPVQTREIREGRQDQGVDERIAYTLTTTPWGSNPTSPTVVIKDMNDDAADVTGVVSTGSPSVSGDIITLPVIHSLTENHAYRVEVKFVSAGNTFEAYAFIDAEL